MKMIKISEQQQKVSWKTFATRQKESNKLESVLILLKTLKMKFNVMGVIEIEKHVICDVSDVQNKYFEIFLIKFFLR